MLHRKDLNFLQVDSKKDKKGKKCSLHATQYEDVGFKLKKREI